MKRGGCGKWERRREREGRGKGSERGREGRVEKWSGWDLHVYLSLE